MSDASAGDNVTQQEREMEEHERQAQAHDPSERSPEAGGSGANPIDRDSRAADPAGPDTTEGDAALDDERAGRPGPAGNLGDIGGGLSGGSVAGAGAGPGGRPGPA